jgi:hypothetical protein
MKTKAHSCVLNIGPTKMNDTDIENQLEKFTEKIYRLMGK